MIYRVYALHMESDRKRARATLRHTFNSESAALATAQILSFNEATRVNRVAGGEEEITPIARYVNGERITGN